MYIKNKIISLFGRLLFAIGGFDGKQRLNSVECYHPENDEWTMVSPMKCSRSGAGVASLGQYIYVIGGYDGNSQLNSVEKYDIEHDVWEFASNVSIARSALSVTVLDGKLYAMGKLRPVFNKIYTFLFELIYANKNISCWFFQEDTMARHF